MLAESPITKTVPQGRAKEDRFVRFGDDHLTIEDKSVRIARAVSRAAAAPLFNLYTVIVIVILSPDQLGPLLDSLSAVMICVVLMVTMPVAPILLSAHRGYTDLDVSEQSKRGKFFLFSVGCYALAWWAYTTLQCHILAVLAAGYVGVSSSLLLLNLRTKVSVHAAGVSGPGTALIYMYGPLASVVTIIWILVVWSRVVLVQHTLRQGALGIATGAIVTFAVYVLMY